MTAKRHARSLDCSATQLNFGTANAVDYPQICADPIRIGGSLDHFHRASQVNPWWLLVVALLEACSGNSSMSPSASAGGTTADHADAGSTAGTGAVARSDAGPSTDPTLASCRTTPGSGTDGLIDNLDDGDGFIPTVDGRQGDWATANDGVGTQWPPPPVGTCDLDYQFPPTNGRACTNGRGFTGWGAGLNLLLNYGDCKTCQYDASAYQGVSFTLSGSLTLATLRFVIPIASTQLLDFGGTCTDGCFNHFGIDMAVTAEPRQVSVAFSELSQFSNWGTQVAWDPRTLLGLSWGVGPAAPDATDMNFEICVDDVAFY